jgi:hypothetical protein
MALAAALLPWMVGAERPTELPALPGDVRIGLSIRDERGRPTGLRLRVTDSSGRTFAPLGHLPRPDGSSRAAGNLVLGDGEETPYEVHALAYDGARIDLPPGRYLFEARKGFEYEPVSREVEITSAPGQTVALPLRRFADFEAMGWYPGDTHVHFPGPSGIRYEMECEGLRVCSLLALKNGYRDPPRPGDGHFWNVEHFSPKLLPVSDARHFVKTGEEFRHGLLAHLIFQNLKSLVWPMSTGGLRESGVGGYDWPLMIHAADEARRQRALVTWAHWPYPSMEAPLDIALGRIDSLDILTTGSPFEHHPSLVEIYKMRGPRAYSTPPIEMYYHYLNCGVRLAVSAGSDKMGLNPPMGSARTYVKTQGPLSYESWVEGIRRGRTFISNYPLLELSVDGRIPGGTLKLAPGRRGLKVKARARSIEPYEVLEIVLNGEVVASARPTGIFFDAAIDRIIEVERGGWIAARAHGPKMLPYGQGSWKMPVFAHTSPVYLAMPGRPPRATASAEILLEQLATLELWVRDTARFPSDDNRGEALGHIARARTFYQAAAAHPENGGLKGGYRH